MFFFYLRVVSECKSVRDRLGASDTGQSFGGLSLSRKVVAAILKTVVARLLVGMRPFPMTLPPLILVIRMLTIVDDCTRECPVIEVDTSLGGLRVRRVLDRMAIERGLPEAIVVDNGPELRGRGLAAWSEERGVRPEFIQPGKPVQNAYIESFNGRLRDECLNANWFTSLSDARRKIETWRKELQRTTPTQFVELLAARRVKSYVRYSAVPTEDGYDWLTKLVTGRSTTPMSCCWRTNRESQMEETGRLGLAPPLRSFS